LSRRPIARSADLSRLLAEGYDVAVSAGHLVVSRIPYVTAGRTVAYGTLITRLDLQDDRTKAPDDHTIFFVGQYPCDKGGGPIEAICNSSGSVKIAEGLVADHRFSAKPQPKGNYDNYYDKIVNYAAILSGPARALDTSVRPNPGSFVSAAEDDDSIFKYLDTASPRAEITAATAKLEMRKVVLIGLGGSGSYILDLIAKTPVEQIHTYDGDILHQHNAFRAPGAASGDELAAEPKKVAYFAEIYSRMRRGIVSHPEHVDASNIDQLRDADFVFVCIDDGLAKAFILEKLQEFGRSFIDVGMGIFLQDEALGGILRVTTSAPARRDHVRSKQRISLSKADERNEYDRNIQTAELNALNAALAVIKWKKLCGFYIDLEREHHSTYSIDGNEMTNEDKE
jgi:hypothetical protein